MPHAPANSIAELRNMFRSSNDKVPPDLRRALTLLDFDSFDELEERFLATTAFLAPWSVFRDSCLLVNNATAGESSDITRLDILWFYTQFDEGVQRHDLRAELPGTNFDIDKSDWGLPEHEKHMYAWMLQTFCVGKVYNPFGFLYFMVRNICMAWEEVFVPIIKAVRASYSVKGRRHYGRLAMFIEERCPSRLAFPEGNVSMPFGVMNSPTPFRMVSRPTYLRGASQTLLTKRNYDETEKELRDVYPQYGGLVERPRFKQKMDEWLAVQRTRAARRKTIAKPAAVQYVTKYQPQVMQQGESKNSRSATKSPSPDLCSRSPLKQCSDALRRSLSMNLVDDPIKFEPQSLLSPTRPKTPSTPKVPMIPYGLYSYIPKRPNKEPKSPLHGVTRQIHVPDSDDENQSFRKTDVTCTQPPDNDRWWLSASRLPRPEPQTQPLSEQSACTTARKSDSCDERPPRGSLVDCIWSPTGAPSAIPPPLKNRPTGKDSEPMPQPLLTATKPCSRARHPSYEGNGYQEEISLTNLHVRKISKSSEVTDSDMAPAKPRSRLPAPLKLPPPYVSQLRVASNDTYRNNPASRSAAAPRPSEAPKRVAWPGAEESVDVTRTRTTSALAPPIPAKSPERWMSKRGQKSEQLPRQESLGEDRVSHEMLRIVSKENIRAALGSLTPESSIEDLKVQPEKKAPARVASPPRLEAYNTHMFPRKSGRSDGI